MDNKKIGIASDHAGYQLKEFVIGYLDSKGYDVYDFGTNSEESCDYPDYAHPLAEAIEKGGSIRPTSGSTTCSICRSSRNW